MKKINLLFILFFYVISVFSQIEPLTEANLKVTMPNDKWRLSQKKLGVQDGINIYYFKRESLKNKENQDIIPYMAFAIEPPLNDSISLDKFVKNKLQSNIFTILEKFKPNDIRLPYKNARGFKCSFKEKDVEHTVYLIFILKDKIGVQIIMDVTTELFEICDNEFLSTIKSISDL